MADQVFNIALGRVAELYRRVDVNDPAASQLVIVIINTSASDATLKDLDTMAAIEADGNTAEVTNSNYARKYLTDSDITAFAPDDTNDRVDLDIPDQTWTGVAAGDAWTDLLILYDDQVASPNDDGMVPMTQHDFAVTPDGTDITATIAAAGFFRAS